MRPLRLAIAFGTGLTFLTLVLFMIFGPAQQEAPIDTEYPTKDQRVEALFSFTSPGSLFPPSAIISLTDDNSTFFLARPAAFGPDLPIHGLSGPLWVGIGFGEDVDDGGELGCSDDPDWDNGDEQIWHNQTTPDILGKVALLKRGGCGFLAKVMWAQNRGATAVVVGDNVRGGALVRMYARGSATDNVSIPSLFTSHTTAHLLSSLMPSQNALEAVEWQQEHSEPDHTERDTMERVESALVIEEKNDAATSTGTLKDKGSILRWMRSLLASAGIRPDHENQILDLGKTKQTVSQPEGSKERSVTSISDDRFHLRASSLGADAHDGLWVTLTPTSVSASPFFDTLLVLVVSPLVTLTVVYALLLLRSRIRRRRWRAPKSVVERLPVRTYQTISDVSSTATPDASSPTTPLLQRTVPVDCPDASSVGVESSQSNSPIASPSNEQDRREREEEKRESGLAAWRRRYGGRQRECVVCLEEYVDGVSQVMSLPCGHEFHADCITPWLVTRRRTCPICKGDVVRSLSQSYHDRFEATSPVRSSRFLEELDDVQIEAAETRNDSPSASRPVPISSSAPAEYQTLGDDVEANWPNNRIRQDNREGNETTSGEQSSSLRELSSSVSTVIWRGFEALTNATGFQRRSPPEHVDRNR